MPRRPQEGERSIGRLEREKAVIEAHSPSARNMKKTLSYVFEHFDKAEPSVQRNFIRQVFDKFLVCEKYEIKLFWRFDDCDNGGEKFALGKEWGPGHTHSINIFPPSELAEIIEFPITPLIKDASFLQREYVQNERSIADIAKMIGAAESTVQKYLMEFGIAARTCYGNLKLKAGHGLPFGKRSVRKRLVDHKGEQEVLLKMQNLQSQGFSYWKIADILNTMKVPTKTQRGRWHARSVQQMLDRLQATAANEGVPMPILEEG